MSGEIALASEVLLTLLELWKLAEKQKGLTEDQIKEAFDLTKPKFMAASAVPIDEVKE